MASDLLVPICLLVAADASPRSRDWLVWADDGYVSVALGGASQRTQGWKIHVSASVDDARAVLEKTVPILLRRGAAFKLIRSLEQLERLNAGMLGISQAGKFITVYPPDDAVARAIAHEVDEATRGLTGPAIKSDKALRANGVVHYRYGAFEPRWMKTSIGEVVPALATPDGLLSPDRRAGTPVTPPWAPPDPFRAARSSPANSLTLGGRFVIGYLIRDAAESATCLAVDCERGDCCVIKRLWPGASDLAALRLRNEATMLRALEGTECVPGLRADASSGTVPYIAIDLVNGCGLQEYVMQSAVRGRSRPAAEVRGLLIALADTLVALGQRDVVHGDIKPANIIVDEGGRVHLIDFEAAAVAGTHRAAVVGGTPGFMSPQRVMGKPPATPDDIYSLGAVAYFVLTGADPATAPNRMALFDRPLGQMCPPALAELAWVADQCLDPRSAARPTALKLRAQLADPPARVSCPRGRREVRDPLSAARTLVLELCAAAKPAADGAGLLWRYDYGDPSRPVETSLELGLAGIVALLADAACVLDEPAIWLTLEESAAYLAAFESDPDLRHPGLYVGEAGVGLALLKAGLGLGDRSLIAAAGACSDEVSRWPFGSPDLFNGVAGRLRFHQFIFDATQDERFRGAALSCRDWLLDAADCCDSTAVGWPLPDDFKGAGGKSYLGYAHGCAGIADALLDLPEDARNERTRSTVRGVVATLSRTCSPCLDSADGLDWPTVAEGAYSGPFWCHGAAGIARFLLRAWRRAGIAEAEDLARGAAQAAARGARWAGPSLCHGLAGNADVLLDFHDALAEPAYLSAANDLAALLVAFLERPDSLEPPSVYALRSPNLLKGRAGVAAFLLRLGAEVSPPHVLSSPWSPLRTAMCGAPA